MAKKRLRRVAKPVKRKFTAACARLLVKRKITAARAKLSVKRKFTAARAKY